MAFYRLFHLNPASGCIDHAESIEATDDVQAVALVRAEERDSPVELWHERRKVLRLEGMRLVSEPCRPQALENALAG